MTVRLLEAGDIDAAGEVQTRAFAEHDRAVGYPATEVTPQVVERQRRRLGHFRTHDPEGSWVAESDGTVIGVALALRRDGLWGLSLLAVDPAAQSRGVGRALLDASLRYTEGADVAVILSSSDPRAMRRYSAAGFALHPQVRAHGPVDRSRLPRPDARVRDGRNEDADLADALDHTVRGARRGPDHAELANWARMFVVDDGGRGYAYLRDGRVIALAASDDATAAALLWRCLAESGDGECSVDHVTGEQQWAVRVAVAAGLRLAPSGPVFWKGRTPPPAYLPDGAYL